MVSAFFLGTTTGHNELDDTFYNRQTSGNRFLSNLFPKASYFIKIKNYFAIIEKGQVANTYIFLRLGYKF